VDNLPLGEGGVTVPGCAADFTIPGLTFADDLVALGASRSAMAKIAKCILNWMEFNEMDVNIAKCGMIHFGPNHDEFEIAAANSALAIHGTDEDGAPSTDSFWYKGQLIPQSASYCYLGVEVERTLSYDFQFKCRFDSAKTVISRITPFLQTMSIPMKIRLMVIQMVVYSTLLYGTEITGGSAQRVQPAQTLINRLLRMVIGVGTKSKGVYSGGIPVHALWRELECPPIHAVAAARRCRLIKKAKFLKTYLPILVGNCKGIGIAGTKWSSSSKGMLTRFKVPPTATSRQAYLHVRQEAWNKSTELRMGKSDGGGPRLRHNLYGRFFLCPVISRETEILDLGAPTRQLIMMRMGTWWGCKNLARAKMVDEGCKFACPFCTVDLVDGGTDDAVPETAMHAVLDCPAWSEIRTKHLGVAIRDIRERLGVLEQALGGEPGDTVLEEDVMIFRGLLGGQPGDDLSSCANLLSRERNEAQWDCPKQIREGHVMATCSFLHALSQLRGSTVRTLIATKSQRRNER
jgi:hypothetical protein